MLHIDDDAVDTINLQRVFRKMDLNHELRHADNGRAALQLMRNEPRFVPNVILLDMNMPVLGGLEFLNELRSDPGLQHITVFVLSSSEHAADIHAAHGFNVAGYLLKPLSTAKYNLLIKRLVELWAVSEFP